MSIFKRLWLGFIEAIIVYSIFFNYLMCMQVAEADNANVFTAFPNYAAIKKIDVSQGDDIWVLDDLNILYHWSTIKKKFISKSTNVRDFAIGSDGTVVRYRFFDEILYIRVDINSWLIIDNGNFGHNTISVCNHDSILTTTETALIQGSYNNYTLTYDWRYIDSSGYNGYYQASCANHDNSLWIIDSNHYVYLYIDNYRKISRSEVQFKQIKAISKYCAIGIDNNDTLWKYYRGTWTLISTKVKSATINDDGDIFYVDYNNFIYKF